MIIKDWDFKNAVPYVHDESASKKKALKFITTYYSKWLKNIKIKQSTTGMNEKYCYDKIELYTQEHFTKLDENIENNIKSKIGKYKKLIKDFKEGTLTTSDMINDIAKRFGEKVEKICGFKKLGKVTITHRKLMKIGWGEPYITPYCFGVNFIDTYLEEDYFFEKLANYINMECEKGRININKKYTIKAYEVIITDMEPFQYPKFRERINIEIDFYL